MQICNARARGEDTPLGLRWVVMTTASQMLYSRRKELGLTQFEVAMRAGMREYDISRYETGKTKALPLSGAYRLCLALDLDLVELAKALNGEDS